MHPLDQPLIYLSTFFLDCLEGYGGFTFSDDFDERKKELPEGNEERDERVDDDGLFEVRLPYRSLTNTRY